MSWIGRKYARYQEIRRHRAGESGVLSGPGGRTKRIYLSDWVVLSRFELARQRKETDHTIHWMTREEILAVCEPYEVISFDVFDTLLCRNAGAPGNVFVLLERENGIPDFAAARMAAEREARGEKTEITLKDIYRTLVKNGTGRDGAAAMEAEWRMEKSLIAPHPMMLSVVRALAERGKRMIAVSDMYLPAARIAELLAEAGYPALERIFVSCEEGVGKAGGALFRRVKETVGGKVLHIGDHDEADGACAALAGWDTALLMNPARLPWEFDSVLPYGGDMIASSLRWQARYDGGMPARPGEAYRTGYLVAGPLTVGFCQWIRRMKEREGWDRLFFSARDGWIMHQVYTAYFGEAEYLPVSRAAVQMLDAEKQPLSYCENNLPAHLGTGKTVADVLKGMGMEALLPSWEEAGLRPEGIFSEDNAEQVQRLILRDREKLAELFSPARENALRWLRERLAGVRKAAVIDTGWKGSAGATLRDFALENGIPATLDTVLMGTSRSPSVAAREERGELFSWLYSPSHDRDRLEKQYEGGKSLACTLMEMLFMTNLPQLMSYEGEGFTYGEADGRFQDLVEDLQAGTLDFARDFDRTVKKSGLDVPIPAAAAYRYFEELIAEKKRLLSAFGSYVHPMAPTPEKAEITFADRMRENGWIK